MTYFTIGPVLARQRGIDHNLQITIKWIIKHLCLEFYPNSQGILVLDHSKTYIYEYYTIHREISN